MKTYQPEQFNPKLHCRLCYDEKRGIVKWHRFNADEGVYVCRFGHKLRPEELDEKKEC